MIEIRIQLNRWEELESVFSIGHTLKIDQKKMKFNGLCTAVSTLEYQLYYSLKSLIPNRLKEVSIDDKKGKFELTIKNTENPNPTLTTLTQSFLIGLKMLTDQYSQIELKINHSQHDS